MSLSRRLLASVIGLFVVLTLATLAVVHGFVFEGFGKLEREEIRRSWLRANDALISRVESMQKSQFGWAAWDDTYDFVRNRDLAYTDWNQGQATFAQLGTDAYVVVDGNLRVILAATPDQSQDCTAAMQSLVAELGLNPTSNLKQGEWTRSGIVAHRGRVALVVARVIQNDSLSARPQGWMVWVKWAGRALEEELTKQAKMLVTLQPLKGRAERYARGLVRVEGSLISYSGLLRDLHGQPVGVLTVQDRRPVHYQASSTVATLTLAFVAIGMAVFLHVWAALRHIVLRRVTSLNQQLRAVDPETGEGRVHLSGKDELAELANATNQMLGTIGHHVASQRRANEALEQTVATRTAELEHKNHVMRHALDGVVVVSADGKVLECNDRACAMVGRPDLVGLSWRQLLPEDHAARVLEGARLAMACGRAEVEFALARPDAQRTHVQAVLIAGIQSEGSEPDLHLFLKDVTERNRFIETIRRQAYHDSLTGLANRAQFEQLLATGLDQGTPVAVALIDLDNFKLVNDSQGHRFGDELLREVAQRLVHTVQGRGLVARLGGDEFGLLVTGPDSLETASALAGLLVDASRPPFFVQGRETSVSISVGVAERGGPVSSVDDLMRNADTAMYEVKAHGKCGWRLFDDSMRRRVAHRMEVELGLRAALETGDLRLAYQPIVDLRGRRVVAAEALLRWTSPSLGPVPPSEFIPIAEETALILPIGEWVLGSACVFGARLASRAGREIGVHVNVSLRQVLSPSMVGSVRSALLNSGLRPELLTLELTESLHARNHQETAAALAALRRLGVQVSLDDFGTGYSSLSLLQDMPIDSVKIDRSFVGQLSAGGSAMAIAEAIVTICRSLELAIVGEGVETGEQAEWLERLGCEYGQGYWFARPMDAEALEGLMCAEEALPAAVVGAAA